MGPLPHDRYARELESQTRLVAEAVAGAEMASTVPTCPAWTLAELVAHVGFGHRWAAFMVEQRTTTPIPQDQTDDVDMPRGASERSRWLMAGARRLVDAVRAAGPGTWVWTWGEDQSAGFWLRRITHDTLVHRLDAELTVGRTPHVRSDLAADSISDLLDMFRVLPRIDNFPSLAELSGHGETLQFQALDPDLAGSGVWLARRTGSGVEWEHTHAPSDVVLRGRASELLLVLSRRASLSESQLDVVGDVGVLEHWLEHSRLEPES